MSAAQAENAGGARPCRAQRWTAPDPPRNPSHLARNVRATATDAITGRTARMSPPGACGAGSPERATTACWCVSAATWADPAGESSVAAPSPAAAGASPSPSRTSSTPRASGSPARDRSPRCTAPPPLAQPPSTLPLDCCARRRATAPPARARWGRSGSWCGPPRHVGRSCRGSPAVAARARSASGRPAAAGRARRRR